MPHPIKYIENNPRLEQRGRVLVYYELIPFNYSFLHWNRKTRCMMLSGS